MGFLSGAANDPPALRLELGIEGLLEKEPLAFNLSFTGPLGTELLTRLIWEG